MKRMLMTAGLLAVLSAGLAAAVAPPPDYAGTWVLDKAKSQGLQGRMAEADVTWVVTQDEKQLSLDTKVSMGGQEGPGQTAVYKLDGSETTGEVTGRMPGKATRKAKWLDGGKMLELHEVRNANFQGSDVTITTTEHWELAEGGKVLKVHRKAETPQGARESTLTFNKK